MCFSSPSMSENGPRKVAGLGLPVETVEAKELVALAADQ